MVLLFQGAVGYELLAFWADLFKSGLGVTLLDLTLSNAPE